MIKTHFYAQRNKFGRGIAISIYQPLSDDHISVATNMVFEQVSTAMMIEPAIQISNDEAQSLMDELWNCGLRPTEGAGSAGSLSATERHLKDMQTIAFGLLKSNGDI